MIEASWYIESLGLPRPGDVVRFGGQELILGEVIGAMHPYRKVWLPFPEDCETLVRTLKRLLFDVDTDPEGMAESMAEVVYFGTPTIVNDAPLFVGAESIWTKAYERAQVRSIVVDAVVCGFKRIVCGLGSGDISPEERCEDLDGVGGSAAEVAAVKKFSIGGSTFTDWVIVKDLA